MTRDCALTGMTRRSAGAAIAAAPALTRVRRFMAVMGASTLIVRDLPFHPNCAAHAKLIVQSRLLEVLHHLGAECGLLVGAPFAKTFAGFETELAVRYQPFEIGRWPGAALDIGQHGLVNRKRQVRAHEVGVLQRSAHRKAATEGGL